MATVRGRCLVVPARARPASLRAGPGPFWRRACAGAVNAEIIASHGIEERDRGAPRRTRERFARAGAALGSGGDRDERPRVRFQGARELAVARRANGSRSPRAPVAQAAFRLGRFPAGRQSAHLLEVAREGGVPRIATGGPENADARLVSSASDHVAPEQRQATRVLPGRGRHRRRGPTWPGALATLARTSLPDGSLAYAQGRTDRAGGAGARSRGR